MHGTALIDFFEKNELFINEGTLYPLLNRMEQNGLLVSSWNIPEQKGHPKKEYKLSSKGVDMLGRYVKYVSLVGAIGFVMSGCSSKYPITYNSNPTGASVVCNGTNKGYTPTTLYYEPDSEQKKSGSMRTVPCTAQWISGARKDYSNTWDLNQFPDGAMQTLQRPNVDGYEKDAQFALQVQQMNAQQRQAAAAENAAAAASYNNYLNQQRNYQLQQQNYQLNNMNNYLRYGY